MSTSRTVARETGSHSNTTAVLVHNKLVRRLSHTSALDLHQMAVADSNVSPQQHRTVQAENTHTDNEISCLGNKRHGVAGAGVSPAALVSNRWRGHPGRRQGPRLPISEVKR